MRLESQKQNGANDFDVYKAAPQVEMGHAFDFEKISKIIRHDPKWIKAQTLSDAQSKRSQNSSSFVISDVRTNIDLNTDTDNIPDDIEKISPPLMPTNRTQKNEFCNTKKGASSIHDYCHNLKHLVDALQDVDSDISEVEFVMQILRGLPPSYQSIINVVMNTKPFPSFLEAKNMLLLHEHHEENHDMMQDPTNITTTALYSVSQQSGKSKNKWNNNRVSSKGEGGILVFLLVLTNLQALLQDKILNLQV
uniref:Uncharacterized protein n=1 Tax=Lactuca sativa TaxID=4236 RepID=A0A9R1VZL8_LACSA|nr:hypothetical protein LSAT_V11C400213370 [Lactuca sativa]